MQLVADKYYWWYNAVATVLGGLLALFVVAVWLIPGLSSYDNAVNASAVTLALAMGQTLYGLLLFRREALRSPWIAALFSMMIVTLTIINLVHNTGQFNSWYTIAWGVQMAVSGMFGLYTVVGSGFLITIYYILVETGPESAGFNALPAEMVGVSFLIGAIGYLIWRRQYSDAESRTVRKLTGQLENKQQQAEMLIQSITDGLLVVNNEGQISLINPAAAKLTEWSIEEAAGIDVMLVVKLLEENGNEVISEDNPFTVVLRDKQPVEKIMQLVTKSGKHTIISLVISPVVKDNQATPGGTVAVIRDISAAREEERRRADFISTASHEMRTPVAAIEGYLALALNNKVSSIDAKARSYLEKAHSSTQHLGKLFQDLLTSAKAEDGRLVSHPITVEMGAYMEQIADSLRFVAEKKGLLMDFIVGAGQDGSTIAEGSKVIKPLYYVHVDPDRIREVITNLFDNAVKYTEAGKVTLGLTGNADVVQLHIKDTGPGIPAADIPHLFQKFYRVDSSATRTIGGTGLGLFISRKIVEIYNGRIWVESEEGKGSTFFINLPRLSSQKAAELLAREAQQTGSSLPFST